jgi:hypothetical protein
LNFKPFLFQGADDIIPGGATLYFQVIMLAFQKSLDFEKAGEIQTRIDELTEYKSRQLFEENPQRPRFRADKKKSKYKL